MKIDNLFSFPIVMIDGESEDRKEALSDLLGSSNDDIEMIEGEAECPYYDFVSILDRWLPTEESLENAKRKKFDACQVIFRTSGEFLVPWNKKKFKRELEKFISSLPQEKTLKLELSKEEMMEVLSRGKEVKNAD